MDMPDGSSCPLRAYTLAIVVIAFMQEQIERFARSIYDFNTRTGGAVSEQEYINHFLKVGTEAHRQLVACMNETVIPVLQPLCPIVAKTCADIATDMIILNIFVPNVVIVDGLPNSHVLHPVNICRPFVLEASA